jgi:hypothetical protein
MTPEDLGVVLRPKPLHSLKGLIPGDRVDVEIRDDHLL